MAESSENPRWISEDDLAAAHKILKPGFFREVRNIFSPNRVRAAKATVSLAAREESTQALWREYDYRHEDDLRDYVEEGIANG